MSHVTQRYGLQPSADRPLAFTTLEGKIREAERLEPPHVSIIRGTRTWRLSLRTGEFLDREPDPRAVPPELVAQVKAHWELICRRWNEMYPENPIGSGERDDE